MRNTLSTKKTFGFAAQMDPFARAPRGARMHPRRDEGGHETGNKTGEKGVGKQETAEEKAAREKTEADKAKEKSGPSETEKAAKTQAAAEKKRADDLQAELDAERAKSLSDDEKTRAAEVKTKVDKAVETKEIELHEHYGPIIEGLQTEIIDGLIESALSQAGRAADDFKTVIGTLDKRSFVGEDGAVKKADVTKWASELAGSYSSKPPRNVRGPRSASGTENRGMGRFLNQD